MSTRPFLRRLARALGIAWLLASQRAEAAALDHLPEGRSYSSYERDSIRTALLAINGELDPNPEGKRVESVLVVALDVIEKRDPAPRALNWLHPTTRDYVIEREALLPKGASFSWTRSDETERNVRGLGLFSVVMGLAVKGSRPDSVRYLIITKDVWSLRVGWDGQFRFVPTPVVDFLSLRPSEFNLLGTGRQIYGTLIFSRRNTTLGAGYVEPRVSGTRLRIAFDLRATVNCATGALEGTSGSFSYRRPLYSTRTRWSYGVSTSWSSGLSPLTVRGQSEAGAICSATNDGDAFVDLTPPATEAQPEPTLRRALVPNQFRFDSQTFEAQVVRSFGVLYKTNLSFGLEARRSNFSEVSLQTVRSENATQPLTDLERFQASDSYRRSLAVRVGDRRISPFFQLSSFTTRFHNDINAESLGLQETFRLGHIAVLRLYPARRSLGSSRSLLGVQASLSYAGLWGKAYYKLGGFNRVELGRPESTDGQAGLSARITSPRGRWGRVVLDSRLSGFYRNYFNRTNVMGGTGRLRGYQSVAAIGARSFIANLEFRSRPLALGSTMLGAIAFYDVGDAATTLDALSPKQAVGLGLRFLAPQLDRDVFRVDVGIPVPLDAELGEVTFVATFGQAFGVP